MLAAAIATAILGLALILSACSTGPCAPEKGGPEVGYVNDAEHDPATGQPLTGLALLNAQLGEMLAAPACVAAKVPVN